MMMVVVMVVMAVMDRMVGMMMVVMMLCHRGRSGIRTRRADHRHRESKCNRKPEGREEGRLHGSFSFFSKSIESMTRSPRMGLRS